MEPKIRLKGFSAEWEETSLGKLSTNYKYGINAAAIPYDGKNKYLRITDIDESTRVFSQDYLTSPGTNLSCCNDYLLEDGDITFARTGASVGKSYIYHTSDGKVYFAGFLIRTRLNDCVDKDCVFYNTLTDQYAKYIRLVSQRSGQPGVNVEELKGYTFNLPFDKDEQKALGVFFQHLDSLIQSTAKKIESLKQVKAASLQSMFPQEGETTPRVRFKGFERKWETHKVSDLLEERREPGKMSSDYPLMAFIANVGVAEKGDRYDRSSLVSDVENKVYKKTEYGDFIYSSNNLETGSIGLNLYGKATISPVYSIFKCTDIADAAFIGRAFVRREFINCMIKWRQGVMYGQWRIHEDDFLKTLIPQHYYKYNFLST